MQEDRLAQIQQEDSMKTGTKQAVGLLSFCSLVVSIAFIVGVTLAGSACGRTGLPVPPLPPAPPDTGAWTPIGPAPVATPVKPFAGRIDVAAPDPATPT